MDPTRSSSPRTTAGAQEAPLRFDDDADNVTWASAKITSPQINGFRPKKRGVFRQLSFSLPRWNGQSNGVGFARYKSKYTRRSVWNGFCNPRAIVMLFILLLFSAYHYIPQTRWYRRSLWFGGGAKFVIILASNLGGGVMEWKGPREWAIERDSVKNKREYAARWGYDLEIVDMATKKRYAHEWRESWEKVDTFRRCLAEYPQAEWFWWLDINTFIMEPSYSLQEHIFDDLSANTYRDINTHNPLNITHPPSEPWLDPISRSRSGDNLSTSINMVVPQDCSGFNLGSFFMRRSAWTDQVLDIWWDPVHYEQRHMQWEHKEQDAFEYLYTNQPWIRPHTAFIPQRKLNSFPQGACGENDARIHYSEVERDFLVNMAGCEWGRDCWGEMFHFRELSRNLNRSVWQRFKDSFITKHPVKEPPTS